MTTGDILIYTERDGNVKTEPRITQEKVYATPYDFKLMSSYNHLLTDEKNKGKKQDELKIKILSHYLNLLTKGKNFKDFITDGSVYLESLNKWGIKKNFYGDVQTITNLTLKK